MIIPENNKNQMKSTRLHLAKGIKLIQRLLKEQASFFCFADASTIRGYATTKTKDRIKTIFKLNKNKNNPF